MPLRGRCVFPPTCPPRPSPRPPHGTEAPASSTAAPALPRLPRLYLGTHPSVRARSTSPPPQAHSLRQVPQNSALPANDLGPPPLPGSACVRGAPTSLVRGPRVTSCPPSPLRSAHRTPARRVARAPTSRSPPTHLDFEGQVWYPVPSTHHVNVTRNETENAFSSQIRYLL